MNLHKRDFLRLLALASSAGMALPTLSGCASRSGGSKAAAAADAMYDAPPLGKGSGFVSLLHLTDCHAQLLPLHYREPSVNIGVGSMQGQWPHLVGEALLKAAGVAPGSALAHALTCLDFNAAAEAYGEVGGFAHLATLVKRLKADRPGALLLDGGDTWQGSATALLTRGEDMVAATTALGVDVMTGHWEFTYGQQRVQELVGAMKQRTAFVAHNVATADFGDAVFEPFTRREVNGVPIAIIGQAFPYTPVANPRHLVPDWTFGIQEEKLQQVVEQARAGGAQLIVLLSHNGMDVDLKLASRVRGIDVVMGGHTHDGVPVAIPVKNAGGQTLVTNAGSHGKFLGVMDLRVSSGRVTEHRYRLLPVFSRQLPADPEMAALITCLRAPHEARLKEPLATTEGLLYRRGNFNGSWDQLIVDALMAELDAPIAFSPGFRWGSTLLPGSTITREKLMDQTAITYPNVTLNTFTGEQIKAILEDVADNLFHPDPYMQQGGDMVRTGGLAYRITPTAAMGQRISDLRVGGQAVAASKTYKVAGWASVQAPSAESQARPPVWEVVEKWLRAQPGAKVAPRAVNAPQVEGVTGNPGLTIAT